MSLNNKKILVTGGAGFIGSHLVDRLVAESNQVTVFDNLSTGTTRNLQHVMSNPDIRFVKGDVTNKQSVTQIMEQGFDIIFHLAAVVGVETYCKHPLKTIDVNFFGTRHIVEAALENDTKIVFTSTSEVYGKNSMVPLSEDSDRILGAPHIARWSYSTSKALCEHLLFALHQLEGLPIVIVRPFNVYGPRQLPPLVVPSFVKKVVCNESPVIYGSGKQTRVFTYVEDVVNGIIAVASHPKAEGEMFNIGGAREITIYDLANLVIDQAGQSEALNPRFVSYNNHYGRSYEDIKKRVPDVSKIKRIGWEASITLEEGLLRTIDYWRRRIYAKRPLTTKSSAPS